MLKPTAQNVPQSTLAAGNRVQVTSAPRRPQDLGLKGVLVRHLSTGRWRVLLDEGGGGGGRTKIMEPEQLSSLGAEQSTPDSNDLPRCGYAASQLGEDSAKSGSGDGAAAQSGTMSRLFTPPPPDTVGFNGGPGNGTGSQFMDIMERDELEARWDEEKVKVRWETYQATYSAFMQWVDLTDVAAGRLDKDEALKYDRLVRKVSEPYAALARWVLTARGGSSDRAPGHVAWRSCMTAIEHHMLTVDSGAGDAGYSKMTQLRAQLQGMQKPVPVARTAAGGVGGVDNPFEAAQVAQALMLSGRQRQP